jgi:hypothetical protein
MSCSRRGIVEKEVTAGAYYRSWCHTMPSGRLQGMASTSSQQPRSYLSNLARPQASQDCIKPLNSFREQSPEAFNIQYNHWYIAAAVL